MGQTSLPFHQVDGQRDRRGQIAEMELISFKVTSPHEGSNNGSPSLTSVIAMFWLVCPQSRHSACMCADDDGTSAEASAGRCPYFEDPMALSAHGEETVADSRQRTPAHQRKG